MSSSLLHTTGGTTDDEDAAESGAINGGAADADAKRPWRVEFENLVHLAVPQGTLILCYKVNSFVDTAVLGKLGTLELAAASYACLFTGLSLDCVASGCGSAISTLAAQAFGARNLSLVSLYFQTAVATCLALAPLMATAWWWIGPELRMLGVEEETSALASVYARYLLPMIVPYCVCTCAGEYLLAQQIAKPQLAVAVAGVPLNIALNLVLVHGAGSVRVAGASGWRGLGLRGSPLATGITCWLQVCLGGRGRATEGARRCGGSTCGINTLLA